MTSYKEITVQTIDIFLDWHISRRVSLNGRAKAGIKK